MVKKRLIWRKEEHDDTAYLAFAERSEKGKHVLDATAKEYAQACDDHAENCNYHEFCGVHKKLLALASKRWLSESVRLFMRDIAERGGLHSMV